MTATIVLIGYFVLWSVIAFSAMRRDKRLAKRRGRRTPENTLMFFAFAGGALGAWLGMYVYRHKTKHASFVAGVPLLLLWNAFCVYFVQDQLDLGWFRG